MRSAAIFEVFTTLWPLALLCLAGAALNRLYELGMKRNETGAKRGRSGEDEAGSALDFWDRTGLYLQTAAVPEP